MDEKAIRKLEKLAMVRCKDSEKARLGKDLTSIVGLLERLDDSALLTEALSTDVHGHSQRMRKDKVAAVVCREELQASAKLVEDGFYVAPKVINS